MTSPTAIPISPGGFDEAAFAATGARAEPEVLRLHRTAAFDRYRALPPPTGQEEDWRRTDPARFDPACAPASGTPRPPSIIDPRRAEADIVVRWDAGGLAVGDPAGLLQAGALAIVDLETGAASDPDAAARMLEAAPRGIEADRYEALHEAFARGGVWIRATGRSDAGFRILLHVVHGGSPVAFPRVWVEAAPGARLAVTELHESAETGAPHLVLGSRRIVAGAGADVKVHQVQMLDAGARWMEFAHGRADRDAQLGTLVAHLGAGSVRTRLSAEAAGAGASLRMDGLFFATAGQHVDLRTLQIHSSPDTTSNLLYKGAVRDDGRSVYRGLIVAERGAVRIDAYQRNNNLVLNNGATADSLPGLRIDADDLKCTHGATCGSLDPAQLFYLRARGLSETAARRLLIEGFFGEIAGRLPAGPVSAALGAAIGARLDP